MKNILLLTEQFDFLNNKNTQENYEIHFLSKEISFSLLRSKLESHTFLTYEIIFSEIYKIYNEQQKLQIEQIKSIDKEKEIFAPITMLSTFIIHEFKIKDITFDYALLENQFTVLNEEILKMHHMECMFKNYTKEILFFILSKEKFLIKYLQLFLKLSNVCENTGYYIKNHIFVNSIEEAVSFLNSAFWTINEEKLKYILQDYNNNRTEDYKIIICNCKYMGYKNILYRYFSRNENVNKKYSLCVNEIKKRELTLLLKKEVEIKNPMEFYKRYILKSIPNEKNIKILKAPKLQRRKTTKELHIKY
jgi:hypothetical protein